MKIAGKFANAEAYDRNTGRFSRMLAGAFIEFAGVKDGERLLDVGCGTGALAFTVAAVTRRSEIIGIDPSASFVEHARSRTSDPRISFDVGNALSLPYPDGSFAKCLALLVIQFVPDVRSAISEMRRVTRAGGTVAACVWSRDDDPLHTIFWDSAAEIDPAATGARDSRAYSEGRLATLWIEGGFAGVEERALTITAEFESFQGYWTPLVRGQGPSSSYLESLPPDKQDAVRDRVRDKMLGKGPDRPFTLAAKAWAVRGLR